MISHQIFIEEQQHLIDSFITEAEECEYLARCGDYNTEDEVLTGDIDVLQAISQRQKHELRKMVEGDTVAQNYLAQCEEEEI